MSLTLVDFVKQQEPLFIKAATDERMVWAKESQFAIQLFQNNDYLAKVAFQNQTSTQNAIINVAAIGISLNPARSWLAQFRVKGLFASTSVTWA